MLSSSRGLTITRSALVNVLWDGNYHEPENPSTRSSAGTCNRGKGFYPGSLPADQRRSPLIFMCLVSKSYPILPSPPPASRFIPPRLKLKLASGSQRIAYHSPDDLYLCFSRDVPVWLKISKQSLQGRWFHVLTRLGSDNASKTQRRRDPHVTGGTSSPTKILEKAATTIPQRHFSESSLQIIEEVRKIGFEPPV